MVAYLLIGVAVIAEVFGDSMMKLSNGFQRKLPLVGTVVGYGIAFYLIAQALEHLPLGPVYAAWTGLGIALTAVVGAVVWKEGFNVKKALGLAAIIGGVSFILYGMISAVGVRNVVENKVDFTKSRINTFYDSPERGVAHCDFTYPYCPTLREKVIKCLEKTDITFHKHGVYVCTEGPRFESAAEIKMFAMMGGDLVGMTNMPESILAREAEMCYTNCSIVTNLSLIHI